ncbi:UDP-glucose:undecaprenyl-phosphate glucose-1-phosphate transferase [Labrenzia sp. THAF82]|uniref:sugar transferase n=1 Tax=Labrenzia sp. THAF82 TaxID=2587861 RepID=UPI0012A91621|nr:sugar transferase [Labrenzia sp. THAF82]QFT33393.1 UDP-glucose:undecaprenyl-phosphate glucose-1-phosphate transferase [Labrenzia sp. THAF82]
MANETVSYDADDHRSGPIKLSGISGLQPRRFRSARKNRSRFLKRPLDVVGASVGLVLLMPLFVLIALSIKLTSRGPVFFKQQRHGLNGVPFEVLKFRTMYKNMCDDSGVVQTVQNDPRVTPVGSFLRKSNFDELPQLINVLRGDMSLVGPRPHVPGMLAAGVPYEEFDPRYMDRHKILPGITGLAQVSGFRGETREEYQARMRLEHDLHYVENQSLLLDIKIILETVRTEFFSGKGY